jgi:hypothetical protein
MRVSSFQLVWWWQGAITLATWLTTQLVITWYGAVPCQHFHLTKYGLVS